MIKSMTGFGRGEVSDERVKLNVELKSVNHRYSEIVIRMPRFLNVLEDRIKRYIQKHVSRGRVEVYIKVEFCGDNRTSVQVDRELAAAYVQSLRELQTELQLPGEVNVSNLLQLNGVINLEEKEEDVEQLWPSLENVLNQSLGGLMEMRVREGKLLAEDIKSRAERIANIVQDIEQRTPVVVEEYRERLRQRLRELLEQGTLDPARFDAEVVIYAERSNIAEEIVRLRSHLAQLGGCLKTSGSVGRKMDFLLQELNREINTISSKSSDITINSSVVEVKSELEKIREQIQNVE